MGQRLLTDAHRLTIFSQTLPGVGGELPLLRRERGPRVVNPPAQPFQIYTANNAGVVLCRAIGRGQNVLGIAPVCVEALAVARPQKRLRGEQAFTHLFFKF